MLDKRELRNVSFHQGDSRTTLPPVLERYAERRVQVDFVLIDGDHSPEGVRADLINVLDSPACRRTVIVLHDTMNAGSGKESIPPISPALHGRLRRDGFRAGYEFSGGDFDRQRWGGLGLVVTGDRAADGYGNRLFRGGMSRIRSRARDEVVHGAEWAADLWGSRGGVDLLRPETVPIDEDDV